jgi:hypothetical protein
LGLESREMDSSEEKLTSIMEAGLRELQVLGLSSLAAGHNMGKR